MDKKQEKRIVESCIKVLGKGKQFEGTFTPTQSNVCPVHGVAHNHSHGEASMPPTRLPMSPTGLPLIQSTQEQTNLPKHTFKTTNLLNSEG